MKEAAEVFLLKHPKEEEKSFPSLQKRVHLARCRLLAFFIDFSLLYGLSFGLSRVLVLGFLFSFKWHKSSQELFYHIFMEGFSHIFPASLFFLSFVYYCTSVSQWGKTLGQALLSIEVFTWSKAREKLVPSVYQSVLRYMASLISLLSLGFFFFLTVYKGKGKTLQDWFSFTEVGELSPHLEEISITELQLFHPAKEKKAA